MSATPLITADSVDEPGIDRIRQQAGEARLARARRAPQEDRAEIAALDGAAQRPALADEVILADELREVRGRIRAASGCRPGGGWNRATWSVAGLRLGTAPV